MKETVDAGRTKIGAAGALKLLAGIRTLIVARGKNATSFDLVKNRPDDSELIDKLLGPTGNLRAPTVRIGATLIVGYNDDVYRKLLGET